MKNRILILLLSIAGVSFSQKKGYLITTDNEKIECFFKDFRTDQNFETIKIKRTKKGNLEYLNINTIKELSPINKTKYFVVNTQIDNITNNIKHINKVYEEIGFIFEKKNNYFKITS